MNSPEQPAPTPQPDDNLVQGVGIGIEGAMLRQIDALAAEERRTRSQMIRFLLEDALKAREEAAQRAAK